MDYSVTFGATGAIDEVYGLARSSADTVLVAGDAGGSSFTPITTNAYQWQAPSSTPGFFMRLADSQDLPGRLRMAASGRIVQESAGAINLTVERVDGEAGTVGINYTVISGTATPGDYTASNGVLSFAPGQTTGLIPLTIVDDTLDEDAEQFTVTLSNPTGGAALAPPETTTVAIVDNDAPPVLNIDGGGCTVTEGDSGSLPCNFVVRLSRISGKAINFNSTTAAGTAASGTDFTAHAATTRTIAAGQQMLTVSVPVLADLLDEDNETFTLQISDVINATPATLTGTGTITDNDAPPVLSIDGGGCTVTEGNSGSTPCQFLLRLSVPSGRAVNFSTATGGGTATAGVDYNGHVGTVRSIAAGQQTLPVNVNVLGDVAVETNESFNLTVSAIVNTTPANLSGVGTINNDDGAAPDPVFKSGFE